jgi:hypothetical protein
MVYIFYRLHGLCDNMTCSSCIALSPSTSTRKDESYIEKKRVIVCVNWIRNEVVIEFQREEERIGKKSPEHSSINAHFNHHVDA